MTPTSLRDHPAVSTARRCTPASSRCRAALRASIGGQDPSLRVEEQSQHLPPSRRADTEIYRNRISTIPFDGTFSFGAFDGAWKTAHILRWRAHAIEMTTSIRPACMPRWNCRCRSKACSSVRSAAPLATGAAARAAGRNNHLRGCGTEASPRRDKAYLSVLVDDLIHARRVKPIPHVPGAPNIV